MVAARPAAAGFDDTPLLSASYDMEGFTGAGAESAAFKSNVINLAYVLARAKEPGGRLSDRDVQAQIDRMAADGGNKEAILASLDEIDRASITSLKIRHDVFSRDPAMSDVIGDFPADLLPQEPESTAGSSLRATDFPDGTIATDADGNQMIVRGGQWFPLN